MVQEINPRNEPFETAPQVPATEPETLNAAGVRPPPRRPHKPEEWRQEFPYPWDEDEIVTRRDTLRFLLAGSGALFLATSALGVIGNLPSGPNVQSLASARVGELGENEWRVFNFPDQYTEGILINLPGKGLVAYSDVCTHLSCAVIYQGNGKLHCPCHEGLFDAATGDVLAGPPTRPLPLIQIAIENGVIYAVREIPR